MQNCDKKRYASPKREGLDVFMNRIYLYFIVSQLFMYY